MFLIVNTLSFTTCLPYFICLHHSIGILFSRAAMKVVRAGHLAKEARSDPGSARQAR